MKPLAIAVIASLCLAGVAHAKDDRHSERGHMTSEDRAAFVDAGIAAVHAGLGLNADQEKMWPAVENAMRAFSKANRERAAERMKARAEREKTKTPPDLVSRLRQRAEDGAERAAGLKKVADAIEPLYKALDDGQKKRLSVLIRRQGVFSMVRERGERDRGDKDGSDKDRSDKDQSED
ncbi:MAG: Spy/CpxP family protein refolding chaperone [Alphaproteobacteria bacterium]|nr:Spy/CpxP family protein refolding chaperone [Alphaproteobacteria bacterium]